VTLPCHPCEQGGWTALIQSAQNGHLEVARLLLDSKADTHAATKVPRSALPPLAIFPAAASRPLNRDPPRAAGIDVPIWCTALDLLDFAKSFQLALNLRPPPLPPPPSTYLIIDLSIYAFIAGTYLISYPTHHYSSSVLRACTFAWRMISTQLVLQRRRISREQETASQHYRH
jgi:hypothetical protein